MALLASDADPESMLENKKIYILYVTYLSPKLKELFNCCALRLQN